MLCVGVGVSWVVRQECTGWVYVAVRPSGVGMACGFRCRDLCGALEPCRLAIHAGRMTRGAGLGNKPGNWVVLVLALCWACVGLMLGPCRPDVGLV